MIVSRERHVDERGSFERIFDEQDFASVFPQKEIKQVNFVKTKDVGTIRGMHLQSKPFQEIKSVTCIKGAIYDVVIDLRPSSLTFSKWFGYELTPDDGTSILIPEGCAHGIQCLKVDSELIYTHTANYSPENETGVHPLDPEIGIKWPLEVSHLSERDRSLPNLRTWNREQHEM